MMSTIIQIMVEVISILGIATEEIQQGRMSEKFSRTMSPLTERCSERFWKKLIGKTDMEDALKRLDQSTQEESRMATAEVLKTTHAIGQSVRGVREQVLAVDNRVASVGNKVASIDDRVSSVDDKVAEVINGTQRIIN
jgi:hypothetical protein